MGGQRTRQDGAAGAIRFLRPRASTWPLHGRRAPDSKLQGIADRILWTALSGSVGPRQVTLDELDDLVRLRLRDAAAALLPTWFSGSSSNSRESTARTGGREPAEGQRDRGLKCTPHIPRVHTPPRMPRSSRSPPVARRRSPYPGAEHCPRRCPQVDRRPNWASAPVEFSILQCTLRLLCPGLQLNPVSYKGFAITARTFQIRGSGRWNP